MAGSVNKVILVCRLGQDPDVRFSNNGDKIVNLSVATSETWKAKDTGERKEKTEWIRVVIFNDRLADVAEKYLRKGSMVYIEGALQTRKWTDQSGVEKYTTEVVLQRFRGELTMLGSKPEGGDSDRDEGRQSQRQENQSSSGPEWNSGGQGAAADGGLSDDIPFN